MTQHLYILTGASRGMGLAMARKLLMPANTLLCISRKSNDTLATQAKMAGTALQQWTQDLAAGADVSARLEQWLREQAGAEFASAVLIKWTAGALAHASGPFAGVDEDVAPANASAVQII